MKKVLVIEDNEKNMYLICFILERMGLFPIRATSGEEGVERALADRPDLILMDIQLPGIDGREAVRRIRQAEAGKTVPIVAITSYAMAGDRERLLQAGCTGYIEKPINPETIMPEISAFLEEKP